jgi:hypothetical protein
MIKDLGYWPVKRDTVLELTDSQGNVIDRKESSELFPPIPFERFHLIPIYDRIMEHVRESRK